MSDQRRPTEELLRERLQLDQELEQHRRFLTILFMDIVGSTQYYESEGDIAGVLMVTRVMTCAIPIIEARAGTVVKTIGDAIMARFDSAEAAVRAAVEMQRAIRLQNEQAPGTTPLRIRVALNYGPAFLTGNDVFGDFVNVAARIEAVADPGEILISPTVFAEIHGISDIVVAQKRAGVELRGKSEKLDLYTVAWDKTAFRAERPSPPGMAQLNLSTGALDRNEVAAELARLENAAGAGNPATASRRSRRAAPAPLSQVRRRFFLERVFGNGTVAETYALDRAEMVAGRQTGDIPLPEDPMLALYHARFFIEQDALYVEDLNTAYGTFLRLRSPHVLDRGDIVVMGRHRVRFDLPAGPAAAGGRPDTLAFGAPGASGGPCFVDLDDCNNEVARYPLLPLGTVFGRALGDYALRDAYMSSRHARVIAQASQFVLEDLNSTNGTFVRIADTQLLNAGDTVLLGTQLLRVTMQE